MRFLSLSYPTPLPSSFYILTCSRYHWPHFNQKKQTLIRLAFNNEVGPNLGLPADYDYKCPIATYLGNVLMRSDSTAVATLEVLDALSREEFEELVGVYAI